MTKLSVNLNKFALIRNSRNSGIPNVASLARRCIAAGAHGITVHPRPDQRHARYSDVYELADLIRTYDSSRQIEFNVEGNPIKQFLDVVLKARPHQCTLVPDKPDQLTSDHGWNLIADGDQLKPVLEQLHEAGIRVSLFVDTDEHQIDRARQIGADRVELYTEPYATVFGTQHHDEILQRYTATALHAQHQGLGVNAGHNLSLQNLGTFLEFVPGILEVSIGHAIICESFDYSLEGTIRRYIEILR